MQQLLIDDMFEPPNPDPFLVVLNYSGGVQSHAIARMMLRGEIETPERFLVVAADPGNEHVKSYEFRDRTFEEFAAAGIHAVVAPGPKMLDELKEKKAAGVGRLDTPANFTEGGGQLMQCCTRHYKIRPINRVVFAYLSHHYGIRRGIPSRSIERWIGFSADETMRAGRIKDEDHRQQFRFPLIDLGMTKRSILEWYKRRNEPIPPRSVCNHCWANSPATFRRIRDTDPEGWKKAVEYDELSRDLSQFGVKETCFVSDRRIPLAELEKRGFQGHSEDGDLLSCDSGHCFI